MPDAHNGRSKFDRQDIRVAVVMNGGVSLAVWIGGVTQELHRLATARSGSSGAYRPLLDLLHATARVDVMAGTSAGGINGAFLALGLASGADIGAMRDLWRDKGAVDKLLRQPLEKNPPSVLKGNAYFLPQLQKALNTVATNGTMRATDADEDESAVELILTGTLWQGRQTSFSDDMGVRITEIDHDALFRFGWRSDGLADGAVCDLTSPEAVPALAAAARCTSSFPAAFEPYWVRVCDAVAGEGSWKSKAGVVNFGTSQHVVDGGLLLNKPIRPALEAIYRQPAQMQVRRLLAYVVPDPGEQPEGPAQVPSTEEEPSPPDAPEVVLGVLTRLRSTDSVSRELEEIRRRNTEAYARRRARDRFAAALVVDAEQLAASAWPAYIEVRIESAAATIGRLLAAGQRGDSNERWSQSDLIAHISELLVKRRSAQPPFFIPKDSPGVAVSRTERDWDWGQTTVQRLRDMVTDVLRRAVWLAPTDSPQREAIVRARAKASQVFKDIHADWRSLEQYWTTAPTAKDSIPPRGTDPQGRGTNTVKLRCWLERTLAAWDKAVPGGPTMRRQRQYKQATALATCLMDCADALAHVADKDNKVLDPDGSERRRLEALRNCLLGSRDRPCADHDTVLQNMLRLEIVQLAFSGAAHDVEQEVELIQVSAASPELITGKQLHHFGAFWRPSWRVNDWIHGRLDGAERIVRMLLSPERLRQLGVVSAPNDVTPRVEQFVTAIRACAVEAGDKDDKEWLEQQWRTVEPECRAFIEERVVTGPGDICSSLADAAIDPRFEACVSAVTRAVCQSILREDLPALAAAVRSEEEGPPPQADKQEDNPPGPGKQAAASSGPEEQAEALGATRDGQTWLRQYAAATATKPSLSPDDVEGLWKAAEKIGKETIKGDSGSDFFARTVSQAAAVTANVVSASGLIGRAKRPVGIMLNALQGYSLAVWAMVTFLTSESSVGRNVVNLAVAVGGALLGVSLVVPGAPLAFPLLGGLLLSAGWTAAALLETRTRPVGRKLLLLPVLALLLVFGYGAWALHHNGLGSLIGFLVKAAVVVLVVLIGWWVSLARRQDSPGEKAT